MRNRFFLLLPPLACALLLLAPPGPTHAQDGAPLHVVSYHVQTGDTMSAISDYFYQDQTRATSIARYNHLGNMNRIAVGQEILIPYFDSASWESYAERAGVSLAAEATNAAGGGSEDVAVTALNEGSGSRRFWGFVIYGSVAAALTLGLYLRSRYFSDSTLRLHSARR